MKDGVAARDRVVVDADVGVVAASHEKRLPGASACTVTSCAEKTASSNGGNGLHDRRLRPTT